MRLSKISIQIEPQVYNKYLITFGFSFLGALINFFFFRQVYLNIGEDTFYYYAYSRRVISFLSPVLLMGLGISLPRAIGHYAGDNKRAKLLFLVSILTLSIVSLFWFLLNISFNELLTGFIWGEVNLFTQRLNIAIAVYLIGLNIAAGIHSYFRGKINALYAGIIDLMVQSILPLIAFLLLSDLVTIFYSISAMVFVLNILLIYFIFRKINPNHLKINYLLKEAGDLLGYGIKRVPGDIFYALLIFFPAYITGQFFNMQLAGVLSFGLSLLTLFNMPATAISFVTLSRSATLLVNEKQKLKTETRSLILIGIAYSILVIILSYYFMGWFLKLFLDQEFVRYTKILFTILWALPMLVVFTVLRSLTDSSYRRAYNSLFIFIALIIIIVFSIFAIQISNPMLIIYGNTVAYFILALLSIIISNKTFKR